MTKADSKILELSADDVEACAGGADTKFVDIVWLDDTNNGGTAAAREVVVVGSKVKDVVRNAGL